MTSPRPLAEDVRVILDAAIAACNPRTLMRRALERVPFSPDDRFNVVAAGKAAQPMAEAFVDRYHAQIRRIVIARGGHPLPDAASFEAGAQALALADENRDRGETLVVLLSGGASAMLAAPAPGVTLAQKIAVTQELLRSGKPIAEINAIRKSLSAIKGGQLALRAGRSVTFAVSDVHAPVEDDPAVIGSGPTVLERPEPDPSDPIGPTVSAEFVLVGSRRDAMRGAREAAQRLGYAVEVIEPPLLGEARGAAAGFAERARKASPNGANPRCLIASGETTVTLPADGGHGRGGRNQEFALAAAVQLQRVDRFVCASIGSDGIDGPTDAAGALVDETTLARARQKGLDATRALEAHDSHTFFAALGDLIVTGPTGTNVGDLVVLLMDRVTSESSR